jgi:DNA-binding CsgD family transcriptional regulator
MTSFDSGISYVNISITPNLSTNTIRTFRARILKKIGKKGTSELIHYAIAQNLTEQ